MIPATFHVDKIKIQCNKEYSNYIRGTTSQNHKIRNAVHVQVERNIDLPKNVGGTAEQESTHMK
jgi:hypothetical protein